MAELAGMNRERWRQRAQRVSDAFGLVLVLVLITYVLASLLDNQRLGGGGAHGRDQRHLGRRADQLPRPAEGRRRARSRSRRSTIVLAAIVAASATSSGSTSPR